mgnify:CR=1 FL=1
MDATDAEYLLSKLEPDEDGGYDYKTFVNVAYGKQEAPDDHYTRAVGGLTPRPDGTKRTRERRRAPLRHQHHPWLTCRLLPQMCVTPAQFSRQAQLS